MTDRFEIHQFSPADSSAVAEFQELLWGAGTAANLRYLNWKYEQNPFLDDRYVFLARSEHGALVGMAAAFGAMWESLELERIMLPCLADTLIAPNFRNGPLFLRLLDTLLAHLRRDGVPWLLDFGDQPASPALLMRNWIAVGPWSIATKELHRSGDSVRAWDISEEFTLLGQRSAETIYCESSPNFVRGSRASRRAPTAPERISRYWAQQPSPAKLHHIRDSAYLEWRSRNPLAWYGYFTIGEPELSGFLIAHRPYDTPESPTTILDCEANDDWLWADLIEAAGSVLPGSTATIWTRDLSRARMARLDDLGFELQHPTGRITRDVHLPNLLIRSTGIAHADPHLKYLAEGSAWDLRGVCGRSWR